MREIGEGLYGFVFAHAVRVDPRGQHLGLWMNRGHGDQVQSQLRPYCCWVRRPEIPIDGMPRRPTRLPPAEPYLFNRPTDVAWDSAGDIFVSDGYGNSRVVKYDKNGRFIASVGTKGSGKGELNLPHTRLP